MAGVFVKTLNAKWIQLEEYAFYSYDRIVQELGSYHRLQGDVQFKIYNGCQEISAGSSYPWPQNDVFITTTLSLAGGKGGFGSMLRAIGAQIEKTTNREACRDLSGRRLRDINEEKRLKDWVAKQAEREREREERKQKKLEKLKKLESEFKHEFHDPDYFKARSEVTDKVHEALEQGIHAASSSTSEEPALKKRKADDVPVLKRTALWVGVSDDDSELDSDKDEKFQPMCDENSQSQSSDSGKEANERQVSSENSSNNEAHPTDIGNSEQASAPPESSESESLVQMSENQNATSEKTEQVHSVETAIKEVAPPQTAEPTVFEPIVLEDFNSPRELEALGLNRLKFELQNRGMKCGGTLVERASRLFSVKGLTPDKIDQSLLAKPTKKK